MLEPAGVAVALPLGVGDAEVLPRQQQGEVAHAAAVVVDALVAVGALDELVVPPIAGAEPGPEALAPGVEVQGSCGPLE